MTTVPVADARRARLMPAVIVGVVALALRGAVVLWAGDRFPPAADGTYYHEIARRIAQGLGSTWAWPDGAVTYAAHYPIGYPALLALGYRLASPAPVVGAWLNALLGTLGALACYGLARRAMPRGLALAGGLAVATHPGLVAYTPALMTEGVTAALLATAAWLAAEAREREHRASIWRSALGIVMGVSTLVRPQMLVLAPWLGLLSVGEAEPSRSGRWLARVRAAAITTVMALAVCAPWVARNCSRMGECGISFNGGWNLLIGAGEKATGSWAPVDVPAECATVWDEARKDLCFGRAARRAIADHPVRWLGLVPAKLASTFDYAGAAGFYLNTSNPAAFPYPNKVALGALETLFERLAFGGVLLVVARASGRFRRTRVVICGVASLFLFGVHAYVAILGAVVAFLFLLGREIWAPPVLLGATWGALAATSLMHAIFFGSGRYSMVVFPLTTALAPLGVAGIAWPSRARVRGWAHRLGRWPFAVIAQKGSSLTRTAEFRHTGGAAQARRTERGARRCP